MEGAWSLLGGWAVVSRTGRWGAREKDPRSRGKTRSRVLAGDGTAASTWRTLCSCSVGELPRSLLVIAAVTISLGSSKLSRGYLPDPSGLWDGVRLPSTDAAGGCAYVLGGASRPEGTLVSSALQNPLSEDSPCPLF